MPSSVIVLPPGQSGQLPVTIHAAAAGRYTVVGAVDSPGGASADDNAEVIVEEQPVQGSFMYLPLLFKAEVRPTDQNQTPAIRLFLPQVTRE